MYSLDKYIQEQNAQASAALSVVMAPIVPKIVSPPKESIPASIVKPLPAIVTPSTTAAGAVIESAGRCAQQQAREMEDVGRDWMCRLGDWVAKNPLLAVGVIAGTYVVTRGK
jgi:hypothetical protein